MQPEYTGNTPLSAYNLNKMQDNVENAINEADVIKRIEIIGNSIQEGTPSIEYEAPIESVGDNINLFDIDTVNGRYNLTRNDNGFITNAESYAIAVNADGSSNPTYEKSLKAGDYTVSFDIVSTTDITLNNFFLLTKTSDDTMQNVVVIKSVSLKANTKTRISGSEKLNADAIKYGFAGYFTSNFASGTITISNIKLARGTTSKQYSPYGQGSIEIYNCNKNRFYLKTETKNGVTLTNGNDGAIILNGTTTGYTRFSLDIDMSEHTVSYNTDNTQSGVWIRTLDENGAIVDLLETTSKTNFITNTNAIAKGELVVDGGKTFNNYKIYVQLAEGDETEYVQHQSQTKSLHTQQPFRAVGDVKDRFVKQNGVWYEEHNGSRYIFTGNESDVSLRGTYNNLNVFQILEPFNYKLETSEVGNAKSNYFECQKTISYVGSGTIIEGLQLYHNIGNTHRAVYINTNEFTTVEELQEWLKTQYNTGTPLYVDYILEIPNLIPCTSEQVEALNDIYSAYGEGMTNIICSDEIEPVIEIVKESKETVQSENDKAISALLARITALEKALIS